MKTSILKLSILFILAVDFANISMVFADENDVNHSNNSNTKKGQFFINVGLLTNWYEYENDPIRADLSPSFTQQLRENQLVGSESDIANESYGIGYYFSNDLSIRLNYSSDIELEYPSNIFFDEKLDAYVDLIEFDLKYDFYSFNDQLQVFGIAGIASYQVNAEIYERNDSVRQTIVSDSYSEVGTKLGFGLQWNFLEDWGVKFGYSHLDYLSMDKKYINFEYRF